MAKSNAKAKKARRAEPEYEVAPLLPKPTDDGHLDPVLRAAIRGVAITAIALTVGATVGYGPRTGIGVGVGGLLAALNLLIFARVGKALIAGQGATAPWAFVALFKLVALLAGTWMILKHGYVQAIPLAVGFGSLPIGIVLGTLFGPKPPSD